MSKTTTLFIALMIGVILGADLGAFFGAVGRNIVLAVLYAILLVLLFILGTRVGRTSSTSKELSEDQRIWTELGSGAGGLALGLVAAPFLLNGVGQKAAVAYLGSGASVGLCFSLTYVLNELYLSFSEKRLLQNTEAAIKEAYRLLSLEQTTEAREKLMETLLPLEMLYGSNHLRPADHVYALAEFFLKSNDADKATAMFRRALSVYERVLGPGDVKVANCIIAMTRTDPNADADDTLLLLRRALNIRERQFGPQHVEVSGVLLAMGIQHQRKERWAEAEEFLRRSLTIVEKSFPEGSPERLQRMGRLASVLFKLNKNMEAERMMGAVARARTAASMAHDEESVQLAIDLGILYQSQGKTAQAYESWRSALVALRDEVGPQHPSTKSLLDLVVPDLVRDWPEGSETLVRAILAQESGPLRKQLEAFPGLHDKPDSTGWTLLQWCVFLNLERAMDALLYAGAGADPEDQEWPPLQIAARWGYRRITQVLFNKSVDVNRVSPEGWTALHRAAQAGDDVATQTLLNKGADPNPVNSLGETPLHIASRGGFPRVVVELVAHKADIPRLIPNSGRSALHLAAQIGNRAIAECLILNCPVSARTLDQQGKTASKLALENDHKALADYLSRQERGR